MIFLFLILIILLIGIFSILLYMIIIQKNKSAGEEISKHPILIPNATITNTSIDELVNIMKQDREEKMMKERDLELRNYVNKHSLNKPVSGMSSLSRKDMPINIKRKKSDLIPYNLSDTEKLILEEFYK